MPTELIITLVTIGIPAIAAWIIHIERAITDNKTAIVDNIASTTAASTKADAMKELIESKFEAQEKAFAAFDLSIDRRLARIESALNGSLREHSHA